MILEANRADMKATMASAMHFVPDTSTTFFFVVLLPLLCLAILTHFVRNYLKLHHIPGPYLASSTRLWRFYHQRRGTLRHRLIQLHNEYGSLVRYAPSVVSIRDASAIQPIYSSVAASKHGSFTINDSYRPLLGIDPVTKGDVRSLVTMEEGPHGRMRRAVAGAFSAGSVGEMEGIVEETIVELLETFDRFCSESESQSGKGGACNLSRTMLWYSIDNATRLVFGEPGGCLRSNTDVQGLRDLTSERIAHWGAWSSLPDIERLIYRNPISLRLRNTQPADFTRKAAARITERLGKPWLSTQPDLLNKLIEAREKYPDVMDVRGTVGIVMSTITGAADTTAGTLTATLYYLMRHPRVLQALLDELRQADVTLPIPKFAETKHLPYLDAVIKESMRLFSVLNWPMERIVPANGFTINNTFIPAGSSVGVLPAAMHMDQSVYGSDVEVFRPERWLSGDVEVTRKMESSFLGFSRGKRVCLGQNIAVMQVKKVVPALVVKYQFELEREEQELDAEYSSAIVVAKELPVRVKRKAGSK